MKKVKKAILAVTAISGMAIIMSGCEIGLFGRGGVHGGGGGPAWNCTASLPYGHQFSRSGPTRHIAFMNALNACRHGAPAFTNPYQHCQVSGCAPISY